MKKLTLITSIFCFFFTGISYAQLKVEADGKAIFGNNKTFSNGLSIYDEVSSNTPPLAPFRLFRQANSGAGSSVYLTRSTASSVSKGMMFHENGQIVVGDNGFSSSNQYYTGMFNIIVENSSSGMTIAQRSSTSKALVLEPYSMGSTPVFGVGGGGSLGPSFSFSVSGNGSITTGGQSVFKIEKASSSTPRFEVRADGSVWVNGTMISSSDAKLKKNIETIQSPLNKILQLRGVTYDWISPEEEAKLCGIPSEEIEKQLKLSEEALKEEAEKNISPEVKQKIAEEKKRKTIGVIAQEVEKVVPEVVKTNENGLMGVAYDQLIGLLIEGIKEQQALVTELTKKVEVLEGNKAVFSEVTLRNTTDNATIGSELPATLHQNIPNPFSESTKIGYNLPNDIQTAFLCVYDMQGKQVKRFTLTERGENSLIIDGYELTAGMYLYALIADGKEVEVKRMILTE